MISGPLSSRVFRETGPWQTRTHCCGHIVADTNVSPFSRARNICWGHKFCVRDTKNVSDFVQKHFVSATNVSQFAQPKKHPDGQQCFRNNADSKRLKVHKRPLSMCTCNKVISLLFVFHHWIRKYVISSQKMNWTCNASHVIIQTRGETEAEWFMKMTT